MCHDAVITIIINAKYLSQLELTAELLTTLSPKIAQQPLKHWKQFYAEMISSNSQYQTVSTTRNGTYLYN